MKFNYGLTENQLYRYVKEARRRRGYWLNLITIIRNALRYSLFRIGFCKTIAQARQLVNHGHITINNKVVSIPSFQCRLNDIISVKIKVVRKL
jgi:small subunit ribosomal protein S4